MTNAEKIELVKTMTGETDGGIVSTYLEVAGNKVCRMAYPFNSDITDVPDRYAYNQVEIAVFLLNKRGAEGETSHGENGITRAYGTDDIPAGLLRQIVPCAAVVGGSNEDT